MVDNKILYCRLLKTLKMLVERYEKYFCLKICFFGVVCYAALFLICQVLFIVFY